ncbi:hypothetical protein IB279_02980 [Ensifer sp. ENS06]|uniref:hypothetical protein n=1 Tax=Ensifer sp. ENS06 TaxID=2769276 RepID=UPI00177FB8EF|nr:hypothetical protein [Ensifer sp. ENS06]MBD9621902.1 hypothetical protein [Ensifer sp. ENS06]
MSIVETVKLNPPSEPDTAPLAAAFAKELKKPQNIDISFFSHRTRKSTSLVGNQSEENYVKARRDWLDFDFKDIVYVTSIRVYASGYENYHEMEFSFRPYLADEDLKFTSRFASDHFLFEPKDFMKGFGLRPSDPLWKNAKITRILVSGVEKGYIADIARYVDNVEREKTKIEDGLSLYLSRAKESYVEIEVNEAKIEELDGVVDQKEELVTELNGQIEEATQRHQKIQKDTEIASSVYKEQSSRLDDLRQSIERTVEERREANAQLSKLQAQLQELKANINLFPTELSGYVSQGTRNIRLYAALCVVPLAIIAAVTFRLFSNAENLLDAIHNLGNLSIFEFLISRIPYVAVSAAVLGVCYSLLRSLVSEIVAINRRRQELFKVSIIATDVSYASQDGMELSDEQRYDLRTQTKMELLKEHLKLSVGEDYIYAPGKVFMEKLSRLPKAKEPETADETASE